MQMKSVEVTKNLFFLTNTENVRVSNKTYQISPPTNRPLVLMPTWLMAVDKHVFKYANIYLRYGFDVLYIQMQLWQLIWPVKGAQVLALEILNFLEKNKSSKPLLIHGFSIGCYLWGEVLVLIESNRSRYQFVVDNMLGQIWDSPADLERIPTGVSYATFPNNKFLQNTLKSCANYFLKTFDEAATRHYIRSRNIMYDNLVRAPMLMVTSKADVISTEDTIRTACNYWEKKGIKVFLKLWEDSPHVCHMIKYPAEYTFEITQYLRYINLVDDNKLQASL